MDPAGIYYFSLGKRIDPPQHSLRELEFMRLLESPGISPPVMQPIFSMLLYRGRDEG